MKTIHRYTSIENEIDIYDDGSIDIELSDCISSLWHSIDRESSEKIYEALKKVFDNDKQENNEAKLTDGMSEKVSKKYRDFSKMSKEDQLKEVLEGNV